MPNNSKRQQAGRRNKCGTSTVEPMATSLLVNIPPYDYLDEPRRKARPKPSLPALKFLENQGGSNG